MASQLTTVAALGTYLKKTLTTDTAAAAAVAAANADVEAYCGRVFASATYTEWHYLVNRDRLTLAQYPVGSITSVSSATSKGASDVTALDSSAYWLEDDNAGVLKLDYAIHGWLKIVYAAGYASIPADLAQIATQIAATIYQQQPTEGQTVTEKLGDYSYTTNQQSGAKAIEQFYSQLARYRKVRL